MAVVANHYAPGGEDTSDSNAAAAPQSPGVPSKVHCCLLLFAVVIVVVVVVVVVVVAVAAVAAAAAVVVLGLQLMRSVASVHQDAD